MLSELFNLILSFAANARLHEVEQKEVWSGLFGSSNSKVDLDIRDGLAFRAVNVRVKDIFKIVDEELQRRSFLSMHASVQSSFYSGEVRIDYDRAEARDSIGFLFGQGQFMNSSQDSYVSSKMEGLFQFGRRLFDKGDFLVGCIAVEDSVVGVSEDDLLGNPPLDWVFWKGSVMRRIASIESFKSSAREVREVARGGLFWKWAEFGEPLEAAKRKKMSALQEQISRVLSELRDV